MTTTQTDRARARRGAKFLDNALGRGWRRKIRRRELAMESDCQCVLGQLYGRYSVGADALDIWGDVAALGFDGATPTEVWLEELRR